MSEDGHGLQGFAPCGRRLRRPWTPCPSSDENALTSASWRLPTIVRSPLRDRGLTTGHSISDSIEAMACCSGSEGTGSESLAMFDLLIPDTLVPTAKKR